METTQVPHTFPELVLASLISASVVAAVVGAAMKRYFDAQIERTKAALSRSSSLYERRVDALLAMYRTLSEIRHNLSVWASAISLRDREQALRAHDELVAHRTAAEKIFAANRLLIPTDVSTHTKAFFLWFAGAARDLAGKQGHIFTRPLSEESWERVTIDPEIDQRLSALLAEIEVRARELIHAPL